MKKVISSIIFLSIVVFLIIYTGDVVLPKDRDYFIKDAFENEVVSFDVLAFGSCHSYTSFNPVALWEDQGITSYNLSRPSENISATYTFMSEILEEHQPKVVLIETWGLKADDSYIDVEESYGEYFVSLMDNTDFSKEKLEVIHAYDTLDMLLDNFYIFRYKDRIVDNELKDIDFHAVESSAYLSRSEDWTDVESANRIANKGYKANIYNGTSSLSFHEDEPVVEEDEQLALRTDSMEYLNKIIALCNEKGSTPIFYRSPYKENRNEMMKDNFIKAYLADKGIAYYDLEEEIEFDYDVDFTDNYHLNTVGADKSTDFLIEKISSCASFTNHKGDKAYQSWESLQQKNFELIDAETYRIDVE